MEMLKTIIGVLLSAAIVAVLIMILLNGTGLDVGGGSGGQPF